MCDCSTYIFVGPSALWVRGLRRPDELSANPPPLSSHCCVSFPSDWCSVCGCPCVGVVMCFRLVFTVPAGFLRPGERQPGAQERPQGPVHQQCYVRLPFLPTIYCRLLRCSSLWFLVWTLGDDACCDFAARWMLPGAGRPLWSTSRTACARPSGRSTSGSSGSLRRNSAARWISRFVFLLLCLVYMLIVATA